MSLEKETTDNKEKLTSLEKEILSVMGICGMAGLIHGYCRSTGIPVTSLTAAYLTVGAPLFGASVFGELSHNVLHDLENNNPEFVARMQNKPEQEKKSSALQVSVLSGAAIGLIADVVGYAIGSGIGYLAK